MKGEAGDEAQAVFYVDAVDRGDIRVIERGDHLGLAIEASDPVGIRRERLRQDLDRDLAVQRRVDRLPDHTLPPSPICSTRR